MLSSTVLHCSGRPLQTCVAPTASSSLRSIPRMSLCSSSSQPRAQRQGQKCFAVQTDDRSSLQRSAVSFSLPDEDQLFDMTTPVCNDEEECVLVDFVMRDTEDGVLSATPFETLEDIIPRLDQVTGLPVLDNDGKLIGVISRKDVIKVRKAAGSMQDTVSQHMTSPAISIPSGSTIQQAGDLMLARKIRRLPVVDETGVPIGIIARSDIFKPLMMDAYKAFMELEIRAIHGDDQVQANKARQTQNPVTWTVKYLYDGDCPMCQSLKTVLERQDNDRGIIKFVNIADDEYKPKNNMGITYDDAMETIHVIRADGTVLMGTEALRILFDSVGLGWATKLSELPIVAWLVDLLYEFLSANRLNLGSMGGVMDAVIASKRMQMSQKGVETCGDVDEECAIEW